MKKIELTQGKFALVDDADFDWLNQWKWHATHGYAYKRIHVKLGKNKYTGIYVYMHRLIMDANEKQQVDHKDGDSFNNTRANLRFSTQQENARNKRVQRNNVSGVKGVWWNKHKNRWEPSIVVNGKKMYIGRYLTIEEASDAYKRAASKYFGEFARSA